MFTASMMEGGKKWKKRSLALAKAKKRIRQETMRRNTLPVTVSLSPEPSPLGLQQEVSVVVQLPTKALTPWMVAIVR